MSADRLAPLFPGNSEIAALMRTIDWQTTSLGDPAGWPQSLRTMIAMLLTSRYQMWMGWGPDLNFFYNDAYSPTLGVKHPHSLGKPAREVWSEIWKDIGRRVQQALEGEATWDEGLLLLLERRGYPEETYHTFSYSPLYGDAGTIDGMLCVVMEETERIISERRLALVREVSSRLAGTKSTEDVLRAVREVLPVARRDLPFTLIYLFDEAKRTAALAAQTGFVPGDPAAPASVDLEDESLWPVGRVFRERASILLDPLSPTREWPTGPWDRPPRMAMLAPIAQQGQEEPAGVFIAGVNPYRACDDAYRSFIELFAGQIAAGLSDARSYEAERRRAEALAEIDRAKTVFFSNVSHEFRTPLTLMLGPLEELAGREDLPADARHQLRLMRRNGARLLRLVNTLLDFSRIEAGRAQAHFEPVDLAEFTRDLASVFQSATERAGLDLAVTCTAVDEPVYVDRAMWEKIVLNLVSNAFKYTLHGRIAVSLEPADGAVRLSVADTGIGIPAAELPRLFDRFHRVEGSGGRSHEGSGIGLALVQELVRLHGGTVEVESEPGQGSTFSVTIPTGRAHLPPHQVHETSVATASAGVSLFLEEALQWLPATGTPVAPSASFAATTTGSASERIVVADDSADMRDYVSRLLSPRWQVEAVANGEEALAAVRRERPYLVVSDIMMPVLDGFGLIKALREDPQTRDVPVLVLSARAGDEARIEGLEAGATDYLVKPFSARELLARVEAQLLRARVRAVEESHARRLASVFAQAPVAIALLRGPEHVFELANPLYLELVGNRDLIGRPMREALPELAEQGIVTLFDAIYESGQPYTARSQPISYAQSPDGVPELHYFDLVFQPLHGEDGTVEGIAAVGYDVSDLARARSEAEVANRAKDEFLAMLGHELRNPLAPILTALQLLRLRGISAGERERQVIERQVRHLVALVDDLLDVSRITRGKIQLACKPVEIGDVVARAIETASPLLEQKEHKLQVDVPRTGLRVSADAERLAQVVSNLLTNAAKYTDNGGHIQVRAHEDGDEVVLRIRDSGIGIGPDMLPRIFDLFVQERQALDRARGGLGLGLAIVRSLVLLHGGRVEAHSAGRGRGAEFVVHLPRTVAALDAPRQADGTRAAAPPERVRRVLVVDDNHDAASMLADAIAALGHITRTAHDGIEGLQIAEAFHPDIALLDIGLPVMDGYEVARAFREHADLRDVKLVAVTGYGQDEDRRRSMAAGFTAHLVKPIDLDHLRGILDQAPQPRR